MRRTLCLSLLALTCASPAFAQSRPDSLGMTCAQARALVARHGAVVLGTGPMVYDRFVADRRFCPPGDATRPATVQTRDTPYCPVGGTCFQPQTERYFFRD